MKPPVTRAKWAIAIARKTVSTLEMPYVDSSSGSGGRSDPSSAWRGEYPGRFETYFLSESRENDSSIGGVPRGLGLPRGAGLGCVGRAFFVGGLRMEKRPSLRTKTFTASSQIAPVVRGYLA